MRILLCFLFVALSIAGFSQSKKLCVTVDDLPVVSYGIDDAVFHEEVTRGLLRVFKRYQIPAIGYVNAGKLYEDGVIVPGRLRLLEMWLENGNDLGNHTYTHLNYHRTGFEQFAADVRKGEIVTRKLVEKYQKELSYFRHPYLRAGQNLLQTDSLRAFLQAEGYTEAPVTIDNEDYLFAKAYHIAYQAGDTTLMRQIGGDYVRYMEEKMLYFEWLSEAVFGRQIAQTLLTHANLLNANYYDELAEMYLRNDYEFVSQEEVLKDEAYRTEVTVFDDWGISWLKRWALSLGMSEGLFEGDPPTPEYILSLAR